MNATITLAAHHMSGQPARVTADITVPTVEDARALAAQFPKAARVKATRSSGGTGAERWERGLVVFVAHLSADGSNGGVNESGLRRLRSFLRTAEKLGLAIEWRAAYSNSYPTREAFERAVAA